VSSAIGIWTEGWKHGWLEGFAILVAVLVILSVTAINDYMKEK
jgi:Ca2+ transporting ATPase